MYTRKYNLTAEEMSCRNCTEYLPGGSCKKRKCPYMEQRIEANTVTYGDVLTAICFPNRKVRKRLLFLIAEYPDSFWLDENHKARMKQLHDRLGFTKKRNTPRYYAAMYLLTASDTLLFQANIRAIQLLQELESTGQQATAEQQEVLSRYVGWGGLADAFDPSKDSWSKEYTTLKNLLSEEEYAAARSSTLNAHYTSPTIIRAIYDAVGQMGFQTGNILEPAMGIGNFFGMLPEEMKNSRLYGVELDSISGRIARQLYPNANITIAGFETTDRRDFLSVPLSHLLTSILSGNSGTLCCRT